VKRLAAPALPGINRGGRDVHRQGHRALIDQRLERSRSPGFEPAFKVKGLVEGCTELIGCGNAPDRAEDTPEEYPAAIHPITCRARGHGRPPSRRAIPEEGSKSNRDCQELWMGHLKRLSCLPEEGVLDHAGLA